ncbi:uncharacterized protein BCR38DRAFT_479470 [Pseudomassariella vexata]|uniref:Uncharacterized protein n=1 Tax=Pseudomassariella vexata TaxID=1141098 RepID=A0A1Y2EHL9_9PEZI|nr:uncharacterized protein BCR38DRAFT_479470 [Pseudomassariella vexata]ORY70937.1 hypothetical protein BCR38DRAFT_479470 [Pseudomassariella vexata]
MAAFIDWRRLIFPPEETATPPPPPLPAQTTPRDLRHALFSLPSAETTITTVAAILLGAFWTVLVLYWVRGRNSNSRDSPTTTTPANHTPEYEQLKDALAQLVAKEKAITAMSQRIEAIENNVQQRLDRNTGSTEGDMQKSLDQRLESIEIKLRQSLDERSEALKDTIRQKSDQGLLDDIHRALDQRIEALEEGVRIIDGKQLDQEATQIRERKMTLRLEAVEESVRVVDGKTRAYSQRIDSVDDSVRVIDSRTKAQSQRLEAVEDSVGSVDGQATLLSHDVSRGGLAIEKLQRQVKMLPDNDRLKALSRAWESRFKQLEDQIEQYHIALEEQRAENVITLSYSEIDTVEIEPTGPLYVQPPPPCTPFKDFQAGSMPLTPSPSAGSFSGSSVRSVSPASKIPRSIEQRRLEMAGFQTPTFSSRQKLLTSRTTSWSR